MNETRTDAWAAMAAIEKLESEVQVLRTQVQELAMYGCSVAVGKTPRPYLIDPVPDGPNFHQRLLQWVSNRLDAYDRGNR